MIIITIAVILGILGIIGAVMPGLPGPILAYAALFALSFHPAVSFSTTQLVVAGVTAVIITLLDYIIPALSTKKFGGSKAGVWGCNIGLILTIIGLPFGPQGLLGVIVWPFLGAFVGEIITGAPPKVAVRSATGAFIGFLCGTGLKLTYGIVIAIIMIATAFN